MGALMLNARKKNCQSEPSVLLGLTASETAEFRKLGKAVRTKDEFLARQRDARWIELFLKHEATMVRQRLK
jgi:hypothetical protein